MSRSGKLAWGLVVVVAIVHFDFWAWDDDTLVFGFVPMALAFHAALSVAAAVAWLFVVRFAWPDGIEGWAGASDPAPGAPEEGADDAAPR